MELSRLTYVSACVFVMVATIIVYSLSSKQSAPPVPIYSGLLYSIEGELSTPHADYANRTSTSTFDLASSATTRDNTLEYTISATTTGPVEPTLPPPYLALDVLYLVQTEKCLPPYLQSNDVLGNDSLRFEVLVLSYKEACDNPPQNHIQYFLKTQTTWTTGRNFLFETAMSRNKTYLYYVFMDDDIVLIDLKNENPWRRFESFLRAVEPAIAAIDQAQDKYVERVRNIHNERRCSYDKDYITCLWYDAIFNAFHYNAVRHILPYDPTFDGNSWWASQMAVIVRSEVAFRGQVVLHTEIVGENREHRPYPRDLSFSQRMFESWLSGFAEKHIPAKSLECANNFVWQWRTEGSWHGWTSSTLCLPPPPSHDIIEPGRYACT